MRLHPSQKRRLAFALSEALTYRIELERIRRISKPARQPTFEQLQEERDRIRALSKRLLEIDAVHRAIVDRCVEAIEEGIF